MPEAGPPSDDAPWAAFAAAVLRSEAHRRGVELAPGEPVGSSTNPDDVALGDDLLDGIAASAELDDEETRVLALVVGIDLDPGLQELVAALQGHPGPRLTLDTLGTLLGGGAVATLSDERRLRSSGLLELEPGGSLSTSRVAVPARVAWAFLGDLSLDPELAAGTEVVALPASMMGEHDLVLVHGPDRVRRQQESVRALQPLVFLLTTPPADDRGWRVLVRQATVFGAGVVLDLADGGVTALTREWVERSDHLAWSLSSTYPIDLATAPRRPWTEIVTPSSAVTDEEWSAVFPDAAPPARRPTAEQLRVATGVPAGSGPLEVMRRVASGTLLKHATRIVPRIGWDDLVLPPSQERQLRAVIDRYHQRSRVHDDWGLSLYPSPGVVALFSGPSGTGKTTSAEVIAHELGMDMFRVDLSALVSKYIGETEKNLEEIFSAAHTGNYVLLFDEADSLFGSRSKVEDAKDRYANMEVSYLLQRLETYDGVVVLTSNFQGNIDQAFLRRIHVTVHFTVPSAGERERIWDRALGHAPRHDLDLAYVAEKFDLSGGSIRNAALTAAFSAAARDPHDGPAGIGMVDVLRAVVTEQTKLGRRPQDAQLGPWLAAVRDHDNH
ncbi:ATP-binding protein [Nocardioides sp. C4-1]|uniref:ATP-binding protein n=1 Tax=Nocardioides sp. C4-1 TaxID=3151851 RepID=UPI003266F7DD